jgi:hypothetical protein
MIPRRCSKLTEPLDTPAKIELAELLDEPWVLPPFDSFGSTLIAGHFGART